MRAGILFKHSALVCDTASDSFTDSSSTTLSDSNCSANSLCFAFHTALNKTWDSLLHVTASAAAKTRLAQLCFGLDFHVPHSAPNSGFHFYEKSKKWAIMLIAFTALLRWNARSCLNLKLSFMIGGV